jgi:hypothetical protein
LLEHLNQSSWSLVCVSHQLRSFQQYTPWTPPFSNTNTAAAPTKPLLPYSHPHLPMVYTVLTDEALAITLPF